MKEEDVKDGVASGKDICESLKNNQEKMSQTIAKLFNKPVTKAKSCKGKGPSKASTKILTPKVLEAVIIPIQTTSIPQGNTRQTLQKRGYIKMLRLFKSDTELEVRMKVYKLFPAIFNSGTQFDFLSAKSKSLAPVLPNDIGHLTLDWRSCSYTCWPGVFVFTT